MGILGHFRAKGMQIGALGATKRALRRGPASNCVKNDVFVLVNRKPHFFSLSSLVDFSFLASSVDPLVSPSCLMDSRAQGMLCRRSLGDALFLPRLLGNRKSSIHTCIYGEVSHQNLLLQGISPLFEY